MCVQATTYHDGALPVDAVLLGPVVAEEAAGLGAGRRLHGSDEAAQPVPARKRPFSSGSRSSMSVLTSRRPGCCRKRTTLGSFMELKGWSKPISTAHTLGSGGAYSQAAGRFTLQRLGPHALGLQLRAQGRAAQHAGLRPGAPARRRSGWSAVQ